MASILICVDRRAGRLGGAPTPASFFGSLSGRVAYRVGAACTQQRPATSDQRAGGGAWHPCCRAGKGRCGCRDSLVHEYRDQTRPRKSRNPERQWQKPKTESGNDSVKPRRCRHEPTLHVTRRGGRVLCKFNALSAESAHRSRTSLRLSPPPPHSRQQPRPFGTLSRR